MRRSLFYGLIPVLSVGLASVTGIPTAQGETFSTAQQFPNVEEVIPEAGEVQPLRETRSGSSYIGVGGNLGAIGGSSVGKDGLIIYSKIGLTEYLSVRPSVTTNFSDDATFLMPLTFDFAPIELRKSEQASLKIAPYMGAGLAVSTEGEFGPLLNGGVDIPLGSQWTATAGMNAGFISDVDFGGFVGIGYNIR